MDPDLSKSEIELVLRSSTVHSNSPQTSPEQIQSTWEDIAHYLESYFDRDEERIRTSWYELASQVPRAQNGHWRTDQESVSNIMQIDAYKQLADISFELLDKYSQHHFLHSLELLGSASVRTQRLLTHGDWDRLFVRYFLRTAAFYERHPELRHLVGRRLVGLVILQMMLYAGEILYDQIEDSILDNIGRAELDRMFREWEESSRFALPDGAQRACAATRLLLEEILIELNRDEPDATQLDRQLGLLQLLIEHSPDVHFSLRTLGRSLVFVVWSLLAAGRLAELRNRSLEDIATFGFILQYERIDLPDYYREGLEGILRFVWEDIDEVIREYQGHSRLGYKALAHLAREALHEAALTYDHDDFARVTPKEFLVQAVRRRLSLRHQIQTYLRNYHTSGRDAVPQTIARDIETALDDLKGKRPKLHRLIHSHYIKEPGLPVEGIAARIGLKGTSRSIAYEFLQLAISCLVERVEELRREEEVNRR